MEKFNWHSRFVTSAYDSFRLSGVDPVVTLRTVAGFPRYLQSLYKFTLMNRRERQPIPIRSFHPCLAEWGTSNGVVRGHYFHQDLLVAQRIFENRPRHHVDVGSRVDGFVAHVASFRSVEVFDIRPQKDSIRNVIFRQLDFLQPSTQLLDYADSASCLHALEHFGLGRYGDPLDPRGHEKGLSNLHAILQRGGLLYLSVPIGPTRIEFNAHRVFAVPLLLELFSDRFVVERMSYVDDAGDLHDDVACTGPEATESFRCRYGCGIFELRKR